MMVLVMVVLVLPGIGMGGDWGRVCHSCCRFREAGATHTAELVPNLVSISALRTGQHAGRRRRLIDNRVGITRGTLRVRQALNGLESSGDCLVVGFRTTHLLLFYQALKELLDLGIGLKVRRLGRRVARGRILVWLLFLVHAEAILDESRVERPQNSG